MTANTVLDAIDAAILRELQNDARISNKDLAARVNVAASTCLERVRALVEPFIRFVLDLPETLAMSHIAGADDFLVHVAVRDAAHLQRLLLDGFTSRREVAHLETQLIFSHIRKWDISPM
jgi:DNA-binding Lrp family transcriptional regulator